MRKLIVIIIKGYQKIISPVLPQSCRFYPTCSEYGIQAVSRYGIIKGGFKTAWRIIRCNPFTKGGYDPLN